MEKNKISIIARDFDARLGFNEGVLLPSITEIFELKLAYLEYNNLSDDQKNDRLAYFQSIKSEETLHYRLCNSSSRVAKSSSTMTKNYFEMGKYSTGYATHSLFPYRGKFHPQLIKSIFNIIGLKTGEIVLDPMCGSGTTLVEATLTNINSIGYDISPFCVLMSRTKNNALFLENSEVIMNLLNYKEELFNKFKHHEINVAHITDQTRKFAYELALLAFYDSMGYAVRVTKKNHFQLFGEVLERYVNTVYSFLDFKENEKLKLGTVIDVSVHDACSLPLADESVDSVITSPPYSFAIDYSENDKTQLEHLGFDSQEIKETMIGLKGRGKKAKLENYFNDMELVVKEISRVLKKGKYFVMIIGSNTNQTGGIRLEQTIIDNSNKYNLELKHSLIKPIKGMRNTMKEEYILFFRKI